MKDGEYLGAAMRSSRRRGAAPLPAGRDSMPRNVWPRGVSQIGAPPLAQILQGFVGKRIQSAGRHVLLELPVPVLGIQLRKPGAQQRKFGRGKLEDRFF